MRLHDSKEDKMEACVCVCVSVDSTCLSVNVLYEKANWRKLNCHVQRR